MSKPDPKMMKQKSRENNEKFKVFLNNKKSSNQHPKPPSQIKLPHIQEHLPQHLLTPSASTEVMKMHNNSGSFEGDNSYSNIDPQLKDNIALGLSQLNKLLIKKSLEKIISVAFSEENEYMYQERLFNQRVNVS